MKFLIFGSLGFVGTHLVDDLDTKENVLVTVDLHPSSTRVFQNKESRYVPSNLSSDESFAAIGNVSDVDHVYFLAANPKLTNLTAATGESLRMLNKVIDFLKNGGFSGRFNYFSSSAVYGQAPDIAAGLPESLELNPNSPYGLSKMMGEVLVRYRGLVDGMSYMIIRPFNLIGPGQPDSFFSSNLLRQLAKITLGLKDPILSLGDLSSSRDFVDVRDLISALRALRAQGKNGETYNIATGTATSLESVLAQALSMVQRSVEIRKEDGYPSPIKTQRGSITKIHSDTGWEPRVSIDVSLKDMLNYWIERERKIS